MKLQVFCGILMAILIVSPFSGSMVQGAEDEDIQRLIAALWRDPISDLDITMYKEVKRRPKSREEIEKMVDHLYDSVGGNAAAAFGGVSREEQLALMMESRKNIRVTKEHTVVKGGNQFVERTAYSQGKTIADGHVDEVLCNVAASADTARYSYTIDHVSKQITVKKGKWKDAHYDDMGTFSRGSSIMLRSLLGDFVTGEDGKPLRDNTGGPILVPNVDKAASMLAGTADSPLALSLSEGDVVSGRQTVVLEMSFNDEAGAQKLVRKWQLDAGNFAMCYREEVFNLDGSPMVVRTADAFEEVGSSGIFFPQKASIIKYKEGSIKTSIAYVITEVRLNTGVSDSFFELKAPADYTLVDHRYGTPLISPPEGHEEITELVLDLAPPLNDDETVVEEPESNNTEEDETSETVPETVTMESESTRSGAAVLIAVSCGIALLAVVFFAARALRKKRR